MWAIEFVDFLEFQVTQHRFYTGTSYIYQGSRYLNFSSYEKDAKTYSSKKRAENALESLIANCENIWKGRVVPIEEAE